jgi:murein DD-endopeptidase MepM/ murein hydrolase activator NlpD
MYDQPRPFLRRIFAGGIQPRIVEGWVYSAQEARVYGGYTAHQAVDFAVPAGTQVLAAAGGIAVASFEEVPIRYPGPQARTWRGEPVFWGHGLHVVVIHSNKLVTVYGHLQRLAPELDPAYALPTATADGDILSALMPLRAEDVKTARRTVRVKAGQVLGLAGITGMGAGQRTYDNWLNSKPYRSNDEEHVHFAVSTLPSMAPETTYIDPFGIYGFAPDYPPYEADWSALLGSLWLA